MREAARLIAEDERLTPVLVPLGDGILAAARDWPSRDVGVGRRFRASTGGILYGTLHGFVLD